MKCPVCGAIEGHGECEECVALAREMQANDDVFGMLREEFLPPLVIRVPRRRPVYAWAAAAAAAVLVIAGVPILRNRTEPPKPVVAADSQRSESEPLAIRIMTPDPDVVILWQIEPEGGAQR